MPIKCSSGNTEIGVHVLLKKGFIVQRQLSLFLRVSKEFLHVMLLSSLFWYNQNIIDQGVKNGKDTCY